MHICMVCGTAPVKAGEACIISHSLITDVCGGRQALAVDARATGCFLTCSSCCASATCFVLQPRSAAATTGVGNCAGSDCGASCVSASSLFTAHGAAAMSGVQHLHVGHAAITVPDGVQVFDLGVQLPDDVCGPWSLLLVAARCHDVLLALLAGCRALPAHTPLLKSQLHCADNSAQMPIL